MATKKETLMPAVSQSGEDVTMTSPVETKVRETLKAGLSSHRDNPLVPTPDKTESTLAVMPDAVQRINEGEGEVVIDRDYLLAMKKVGFPIAWYVYFAQWIDVAAGYQEQIGWVFTDNYINAFCQRWEIELGDFLAAQKPLLKKGMNQAIKVQMTLDLFDLNNLPED
jgi:hypothetical protein